MQFLSKENADYITEVLISFLKDKHNVEITDGKITEESYRQLLSNTMTYVQQQHKLPVQEMNKIVLTELKEKVLSIYHSPQISDDNQFLNKLQKLELQRKTFNSTITQQLEVTPADSVYSHPQSLAAPLPATSQQVTNTIYVTAPTSRGTELLVSSWQRDWVVTPERNKFTWKGPLPPHIDTTNVRIGCVIISKEVSVSNPLLSIFIEGPNGYEVHGSILYEKTVGEYSIYKPISEGLSYLYVLALPWTITLETSDGEYVSLGNDKLPYHVTEHKNNETHIIVVEPHDFKVGDQVRVYTIYNKRIIPSTVVSMEGNKLVLSGIVKEGFLLNFTRQLTVILETYSLLGLKK